jgi:radical SAM superfamily enzyme YgiQ (UPF0313 family)
MKIALVFPRFKYPSGEHPLGIAYIASYLKKHTDAMVEIIDTTFDKKPKERIKKIFSNKKYDIVGVSLMTSMLEDANYVAHVVKKYNPDSKVIFGGPYPTVLPDKTINEKNVDAICIREGEITFYDIVKNKGDFEGIEGIWYKKNGKIIKNNPRMPIQNLDELPFPAWKLLPMDKYFKSWFQMDSTNIKNIKGASLIASRGCPYNCTYCQPTLNLIFGGKLRKRSAKNIVAELAELKKRYNINAFGLQDDTFIIDKEWVFEFCDQLEKSKMGLVWQCNLRANLVTEELLSRMKKAGLVRIAVGIESANQRILDDIYKKGITIEQVKNTLNISKKLGLYVHGYFMIGAPTETINEVKNSIEFARKNYMQSVTFSVTTPLPKTYLYEMSKKHVTKGFEHFDYYTNYVYDNKITVPEKKLKYFKKMGYLYFHLTPKRLFHTIISFLSPSRLKKTLLMLRRF